MQIAQEFVDTDEYRQMVLVCRIIIGFLFNRKEGLHIYDGRVDNQYNACVRIFFQISSVSNKKMIGRLTWLDINIASYTYRFI